MILPDQPLRDRFALETGHNFSVIAPAGVGKTTAIAQRIVQLAREDAHARDVGRTPRLPRLVVVTFTRKAADELRERARRELVSAQLPPWVLGWFNDAFFGTIHSFCLELLRRYGPLLGMATKFSVETDDAALRLAFQRDTADVAARLPEPARAAWRRYGSAASVWPLVWGWTGHAAMPPPPGPCPKANLSALFEFTPKTKRQDTTKNIRRAQERLRRWQDASPDARALGVPEAERGGNDFIELWGETFQPLREWLASAAAYAAVGLAQAYARFKEQRGSLAYGDFVHLAARLLREPATAKKIHAQEFSVLLDEAQDTDPLQFAVLVGVAQPKGAPGLWVEGRGAPPGPGRFSMVGDPQQAIFDRGDVHAYQRLHDRLVESGAAAELKFSVTMRCDEAIVAGVNFVFEDLLDGVAGQALFVKLQARPTAGPGGVWKLPMRRLAYLGPKSSVAERTRAEADVLAQWLAAAGPSGVGVRDWSELAVLAPRRNWLEAVATALGTAGLRGQIHSSYQDAAAEPARAWLGALLTVTADPDDVFELAGVLREVFGISDDEIYQWRQDAGNSSARLSATLALLRKLSREARDMPLRDAVEKIAGETQLRARLAAIGVAGAALDELLDLAAMAEARGENLAAFARSLLRGPAEAGDPVARPGEVQLLTSFKAKGLEWPVVILFGLFRGPKFKTPDYPCWLPPAHPGRPAQCLYDKYHAAATSGGADSWKSLQREERRAAFERLLYVAGTRPRHALILPDAAELFADEDGEAKGDSLAEILGLLPGGSAREWWENLPLIKTPLAHQPPDSRTGAAADSSAWTPNPMPALDFAAIKQRAEDFPRRVRPSTLARHEKISPERAEPDLLAPPDFPEEQPLPAAAVEYGNWWHALMEGTPWAAGRKAWAAHWEKFAATAPDPVRAQEEIARLLASPLAARLAAPGLQFAAEMPFLWRDGARAFDGCMDLAVWDESAKRWLVVDWKTDRVEGDAAAQLRNQYGPQIETYLRALAGAFNAPVEGILYSTRAGVAVTV